MITKDNIASHELIGLQAQIVDASNKQIVGFAGKVVDETKFMFTLSTQNGLKRFPKDYVIWKFFFEQDQATIDGAKLAKRSYERMGVRA